MDARTLVRSLSLGVGLLLVTAGSAVAQPQPGECATGFCGTPKNNGGGGCGCGGGSILVNNTDIGQTYSTSDDYDADGLEDDFDNCPFMANRDQADKDGDKIGDVCDNCPSVPNVLQKNTDGDTLGDVCDADMDGDGVANNVDNCPLVSNPDQAKDAPGRYGAACDMDSDKDTIDDAKDNCPGAYNPDQIDTNGDGKGDACDLDIDGDLVPNQLDNCPLVSNPGPLLKDMKTQGQQLDADRDGVGDACQTHGFCFVAAYNRAAKCLDPQGVFSVTAVPAGVGDTGKEIWPAIFSNRPGASINYSWAITQQPEGASVTITRPRGSVSQMVDPSSYGYAYSSDGERPVFTPTHPGLYKLNLAADLAGPDGKFPGFVHAESEIEINVAGPITNTGGCGMSRRAAAGSSFACAGLLLAVGALVRRRRRA